MQKSGRKSRVRSALARAFALASFRLNQPKVATLPLALSLSAPARVRCTRSTPALTLNALWFVLGDGWACVGSCCVLLVLLRCHSNSCLIALVWLPWSLHFASGLVSSPSSFWQSFGYFLFGFVVVVVRELTLSSCASSLCPLSIAFDFAGLLVEFER